MSTFSFTSLQADETILFGITTTTCSRSSDVSVNGTSLAGSSEKSERRLGITNHRVIVEQADAPEATLIVPNADVRKVTVKHEVFVGHPRLRITEIESASAGTTTLDMLLGDADDEARIKQAFPAAEIVTEQEQKGWLAGMLDRIGLG